MAMVLIALTLWVVVAFLLAVAWARFHIAVGLVSAADVEGFDPILAGAQGTVRRSTSETR
jgi:hypothetical protein